MTVQFWIPALCLIISSQWRHKTTPFQKLQGMGKKLESISTTREQRKEKEQTEEIKYLWKYLIALLQQWSPPDLIIRT